MADIILDYIDIYKGLQKSFLDMSKTTTQSDLKIYFAQEHFINNHPEFDEDFIEKSRTMLVAALRKFNYGALVGTQLHCLYNIRNFQTAPYKGVYYQIPNPVDNESPFLDELLLDQALFIWRSFLDFYMKYLVFFCTKTYIVNMNLSRFNKTFKEAQPNSVSEKVKTYFDENVFNPTSEDKNWGNLLRDFRDKTSHNKLIKLPLTIYETGPGQSRLEPTINNEAVAYFVQLNFENNIFEMFKKLTPILYEIDWIPGAYNSNMYK